MSHHLGVQLRLIIIVEETDDTSNSYNYIERQNIEEERYIWQLCFCEVIVKIQADRWKKFVFVHSEFKKVFSFQSCWPSQSEDREEGRG